MTTFSNLTQETKAEMAIQMVIMDAFEKLGKFILVFAVLYTTIWCTYCNYLVFVNGPDKYFSNGKVNIVSISVLASFAIYAVLILWLVEKTVNAGFWKIQIDIDLTKIKIPKKPKNP